MNTSDKVDALAEWDYYAAPVSHWSANPHAEDLLDSLWDQLHSYYEAMSESEINRLYNDLTGTEEEPHNAM